MVDFTSTADLNLDVFSPKKQLNHVDFTRMHEHRDAHLTCDRVKC